MAAAITIALDAMGGDAAPGVVVAGAERSRQDHADLRFLMVGDTVRIKPLLDRFPELGKITEIRHTDEAVSADDKPSHALRRLKKSSMRLAIDAVKAGEAQGVVSAGNTGALMAVAKFVLRPLPGIDRPAMVSVLPSLKGPIVMLDLGANVACDANNLVQFAVMGAAFARILLDKPRPTVGLLNVGVEEMKGHDEVRAAGEFLRGASLPFDFANYVEGDDIAKGTVDVVVTDGFTGNVALKTAEGMARMITSLFKTAFESSTRAKLGYLLAASGIQGVRELMDPRRYNGAMFLGLDGIALKSHGGTDALGYANAINTAGRLVRDNLGAAIIDGIRQFGSLPEFQTAAS